MRVAKCLLVSPNEQAQQPAHENLWVCISRPLREQLLTGTMKQQKDRNAAITGDLRDIVEPCNQSKSKRRDLHLKWLHRETDNTIYYMASSASGKDEPNRALWLATRAGRLEPSCPLGTTRCIPQAKFHQKPFNCWFSHDVTKFQTSELLIPLRFYFYDV